MSVKAKRWIAISVLVLLLIAIVSVIVIEKLSKAEQHDSEEYEAWKNLPYGPTDKEDDPTFASYQEAFAEVIQRKIYVLQAESEETGSHAGITSAYLPSQKIPTAVILYVNRDGKLCYLILKYCNNKVFSIDEEAPFDAVTECNNLLIFSDCDLVLVRSGIDSALGKQIIYDYANDHYAAVKYNEYENGFVSDMDDTLGEYNADAKTYASYNSCAVCENVIPYLSGILGITLEID